MFLCVVCVVGRLDPRRVVLQGVPRPVPRDCPLIVDYMGPRQPSKAADGQ